MSDAVSVIIPTYNRAHLVVRAIRSALAAMRPEDELIVVDDGSTDITYDVLLDLYGHRELPYASGPTWWLSENEDGQRRFTYVRIANAGPGAARNAGIERARHPLLAFLDSDDVWPADSLEIRRRALELVPEAVCAFGDLSIARKGGAVQRDILHSVHRHHPRVGSESAPSLRVVLGRVNWEFDLTAPLYVGDMEGPEKHAHWITCQTALVRRSLAPGWRFPADVGLLEDYEGFSQLSKRGPCAYLDTEIAQMVDHDGDRLTDVEEVRHLDARVRVIDRVWGGCEIRLRKLQLRRRVARGQAIRSAARSGLEWARSLVKSLRPLRRTT